jgi:hypothetical protein
MDGMWKRFMQLLRCFFNFTPLFSEIYCGPDWPTITCVAQPPLNLFAIHGDKNWPRAQGKNENWNVSPFCTTILPAQFGRWITDEWGVQKPDRSNPKPVFCVTLSGSSWNYRNWWPFPENWTLHNDRVLSDESVSTRKQLFLHKYWLNWNKRKVFLGRCPNTHHHHAKLDRRFGWWFSGQ